MLALLLVAPPGSAASQGEPPPQMPRSGAEVAVARSAQPAKMPTFMRAGFGAVDREAFRTATLAIRTRAATALTELWRESVAAGQERVACLAGRMVNGVFHITRAMPVPTEMADSMQVSPGPSLERCGPPDWQGTVHTHIARFNGRPYSTLSPSDRHVNGLWRERWQTEGIFCVLFSDTEAYCEYGLNHNGDIPYADREPDPAELLFRPRS